MAMNECMSTDYCVEINLLNLLQVPLRISQDLVILNLSVSNACQIINLVSAF